MISVNLEHHEGEGEPVYLGKVELSEVPEVLDALIGMPVYLEGTRTILSGLLEAPAGDPVLTLRYGDEI